MRAEKCSHLSLEVKLCYPLLCPVKNKHLIFRLIKLDNGKVVRTIFRNLNAFAGKRKSVATMLPNHLK